MHIIKVLIPKLNLKPFDYIINSEDEINLGALVVVPYRKTTSIGIVWQIGVKHSPYELKTVISYHAEYKLSEQVLKLINSLSQYYMASLGSVCKLALPVNPLEGKAPKNINEDNYNQGLLPKVDNIKLSNEQLSARDAFFASKKVFLLKGVTGSGKTEIYFEIIKRLISENKQILLLLPEIGLLDQIANRFERNFGFKANLWHSQITKAKKRDIYKLILDDKLNIIIGTRSSLFLPFKRLGAIIIDEEHDNSYKQYDGVIYHARDMAVLRAKFEDCRVLLGSATPSFESLNNVNNNKYDYHFLSSRFKGAAFPDVKLIDMRQEDLTFGEGISSALKENIISRLENNEQVMLFLNKIGYAPLMICKKCSYRFCCTSCSTSMVLHKKLKRMQCHHCGLVMKIHNSCPECKEGEIIPIGPGIERLEEEVKAKFPNSKIAVISSEVGAKNMADNIKLITKGEIDIIIGTQLITKGYHFPHLTLVGIIDADNALFGGDFRGKERTMQIMHQVSGRAGRDLKNSAVLVQTYSPENKLNQALKNKKFDEYIDSEMISREESSLPPFGKMAMIILSGYREKILFDFAKALASNAPKSSAAILGPAEAPIFKLANKFRYRIIVSAHKSFALQEYIQSWLDQIKCPSSVHIKIDIDPQTI